MSCNIKKALLTISVLAALATTSAPSFAWTCGSNSICVETKPRGSTLLVRYRAEAPVTHVNIIPIVPHGGQFEVGSPAGAFSLPIGFESRVRFKMQKCVRGGIGQRSTCGDWVIFSRNVG